MCHSGVTWVLYVTQDQGGQKSNMIVVISLPDDLFCFDMPFFHLSTVFFLLTHSQNAAIKNRVTVAGSLITFIVLICQPFHFPSLR